MPLIQYFAANCSAKTEKKEFQIYLQVEEPFFLKKDINQTIDTKKKVESGEDNHVFSRGICALPKRLLKKDLRTTFGISQGILFFILHKTRLIISISPSQPVKKRR